MTPLIDVGPAVLRAAFADVPLAVRHGLVGHPLLSLEALADLAERLPVDRVEQNRADLDVLLPGGGNPRGGVLAPGQLIRGIETNNRWVVLWNVEHDPQYLRLLDEVLDPVAAVLGKREGGMCRREAFVFISSASSVTPVHFDPEHNFLLQVCGVKQMHVARFSTVADGQRELERYYTGGHRNIEHLPDQSETFRLEPGTGVYVPSHAPHWVTNEGAFCISLSVTFHTPAILRRGTIHGINRQLRRLGVSPSPPALSPARDGAKVALHKSLTIGHHLRERWARAHRG